MKCIVGLGNPGSKYNQTRHNIGFDVVNAAAYKWNLSEPSKKQLGCLLSSGLVGSEKCLLALPQSYMNRSGQPVASLMGYYKLKPQDIIVVHDEVALDFGVVRCKKNGGHGGHNGLRDIIQHIGKDFIRVRMGVGNKPHGWDLADYVLGKWKVNEREEMDGFIDLGAKVIESILEAGISQSMNQFNVRNRTPKQQPIDGS